MTLHNREPALLTKCPDGVYRQTGNGNIGASVFAGVTEPIAIITTIVVGILTFLVCVYIGVKVGSPLLTSFPNGGIEQVFSTIALVVTSIIPAALTGRLTYLKMKSLAEDGKGWL